MEIKKELLYTNDHEWVKDLGDGTYHIGITDYAQDKIGDISFIELPEVDATFLAQEVFGTIESFKAASDVYAPFEFTVLDTNTDLEDEPEKINESPYDAWLIKVSPEDISGLLSSEYYEKLTEGE